MFLRFIHVPEDGFFIPVLISFLMKTLSTFLCTDLTKIPRVVHLLLESPFCRICTMKLYYDPTMSVSIDILTAVWTSSHGSMLSILVLSDYSSLL